MTGNPEAGPSWMVTIEKFTGGEYWVNRYFVSDLTMDGAIGTGNAIANIEQVVHSASVALTKMSISTIAPGDNIYQTVILNKSGTRPNTSNYDLAPLFVVARVDFSVTGSRPSRKYLRGVLTEGDFTTFALSTVCADYINLNYATPLANLQGYVDPQGQFIVAGAVNRSVGMRQLRRGSKKKRIPLSGIPV